MRNRSVLAPAALATLAACSGNPDDAANVIGPNAVQEFREVGVREDAETDAGMESRFPAAYRFECIHIDKLGEPNANGVAPFQAGFLNSLWTGDIAAHRLNILIGIESLDTASGSAQMFIGSGVGRDDPGQCQEQSTAGQPGTRFGSDIRLGEAQYVPAAADVADTCVAAAPGGTPSIGTVDLVVPAAGAIYIYAQDENAVPYNCTPDGVLPDAVPLREVRATVTVDEFGDRVAGELVACLTAADISTVCSCIRNCATTDPTDRIPSDSTCGGCPRGAIPLGTQLSGLRETPDCQTRVGAPGFELRATFHAVRLPHEPAVCQ